MLKVEHLSSACPCKALSWALTGDGTRLPDLQLRALPCRGGDLPGVRSWQPVLRAVCSAGAGGKAARGRRAVSEDRSRQAEKVTHHGDLGMALGQDSAVATLECIQESQDERREESPEPPDVSPPPQRCCDFCGRPCGCAVRTSSVGRPPSIDRRGPRLPGHAGRLRRC